MYAIPFAGIVNQIVIIPIATATFFIKFLKRILLE